METKYVGRLVDVSQWDDPPELGIVIAEDDDFVPTVLTIYLFELKMVSGYHTTETVKFVED